MSDSRSELVKNEIGKVEKGISLAPLRPLLTQHTQHRDMEQKHLYLSCNLAS